MMHEPGKSDRSKYPGSLRSEPEDRQSVMDYQTFYEQVYVKWRYADRRNAEGSDLTEENADPAKGMMGAATACRRSLPVAIHLTTTRTSRIR